MSLYLWAVISSLTLGHLCRFLSMAEPLYGPSSPYQDTANIPPGSDKLARAAPWQYPLHDLLSRPSTDDAACIPIPQLKYRNLGVRQLSPAQTVLDTQTRRNAIRHGNSPEKVSGSHDLGCSRKVDSSTSRCCFTPPTRLALSSSMARTLVGYPLRLGDHLQASRRRSRIRRD